MDRLPRSGISNLDRLSSSGIIMGLVAMFRHNHWIGIIKHCAQVFLGSENEDAYEFILDCSERLHKLGIVHQHGVEFVSFQLQKKYVPRTLRDRKKDKFIDLEQGGMNVAAYEVKFHVLSRYATQLVTTEEERIQ
ncbi:hypothetical protein MTR67_020630 [Solanum verrucosum]|uniref:Retrotransposon gag domain-containing protein n=1 Tax=Solanum verrucosum TaxID=315347 RepID=A0AAF0QRE4_SOLVR|nr:hypothetical protein MTR67_020630 [Solanum verrucosum]